MAVNPVDFYINQTEIDSRISTLVSDLHTNIDSAALNLQQDVVTNYVQVNPGEFSEFNTKMKLITKDFRWYKDLSNAGETYRLMGAYADDYSYSEKEIFVLDKVSIAN